MFRELAALDMGVDHLPDESTILRFSEWDKEHGIELLFIQPGKPNQNAFIERFNKSFRCEVLDANLFNSITDVQAAADDWLMHYNEYRSHESLGDVPSAVYLPRVLNQDVSSFNLSTVQVSLRGIML